MHICASRHRLLYVTPNVCICVVTSPDCYIPFCVTSGARVCVGHVSAPCVIAMWMCMRVTGTLAWPLNYATMIRICVWQNCCWRRRQRGFHSNLHLVVMRGRTHLHCYYLYGSTSVIPVHPVKPGIFEYKDWLISHICGTQILYHFSDALSGSY